MASTYLSRSTNSGSTGTKWTFSAWVKRAGTGENNCIWNQSNDANNTTYNEVAIKSANELDVQIRNGTSGDNGTYIRRRTSRLFRDCNAFYHIVVRYDSTNSTAGDRLRLYVNGVQETSMQESVGTVPQNQVTVMATSGADQTFGRGVGSSTHYWNGVISHAHLCDGYSYAPSEFGETDSTTGEWKIKTSPSVSYGTNGWFILKDGNSVTDQSGQSNNWSVTAGTLTKTEDCPDNVFCTLNPLNQGDTGYVFSNGNTKGTSSGQWLASTATLGMNSGKYYWELKYGSGNYGVGVVLEGGTANRISNLGTANYAYCSKQVDGWEFFHNNSAKKQNNSTQVNWGSTLSSGDIMNIAYDADTGKLYTGKNGAWFESGNPETGAYPMYTLTTGTDKFYMPCLSIESGNSELNFGNGAFGSTQLTGTTYQGAGSNGIFQYQPPSGFTALSTKGLNQ